MKVCCLNNLVFYRVRSLYFYSLFLIVVLLFMIFVSIFYKFHFYFSYIGFVCLEDDYYVSLLLDNNEIDEIKKTFLVYDKNRVSYDIIKIDSDYVLTDTGSKRLVHIKFQLNDNDKIVNNVVSLKFGYESTLFGRLKEMFL